MLSGSTNLPGKRIGRSGGKGGRDTLVMKPFVFLTDINDTKSDTAFSSQKNTPHRLGNIASSRTMLKDLSHKRMMLDSQIGSRCTVGAKK